MMNYYIITLFSRIFIFPRKGHFLSFMTIVCFVTIVLVTIVLTLTISIQNSFHALLYKQLQGFQADLVLQRTHGKPFLSKQLKLLNSMPYIASWAPVFHEYALIKKKDSSTYFPVYIKIIHEGRETQTSSINNYILSEKKLSDLLSNNNVICGKILYEKLHLKTGMIVDLISFTVEENWWGSSQVATKSQEIKIAGVIKTDIEEFDETTIICSYDFAKILFDEIEIETIAVKLSKKATEDQVRKMLTAKEPDLKVRTWKEMKPSLTAALHLEGYVTYLYLLLLLLLTIIIIGSLFLLQLLHNQAKIILLHMLGISTKILYFFSTISLMLQTMSACIVGLIFSYGFGIYISTHTPLSIQKAYNITQLPIIFSAALFIKILFLIIIITLITMFLMLIFFSKTKKFTYMRQEW